MSSTNAKVIDRRTNMYKKGISSTQAHKARLKVPLTRRQQRRKRVIADLRLAPSQPQAPSPGSSILRQPPISTNSFPTIDPQNLLQFGKLVQHLFNPSSNSASLQQATHHLSVAVTDVNIATTLVQTTNGLLPRLMVLLTSTSPNALEQSHFVSTFTLINTLLQHEKPGRVLSEEVVHSRGTLQVFIELLKHENVKDVALASVMALLNMASHDNTRRFICSAIVRTSGAIDAIRRMLLNPHIGRSTSTVLWLLCNLIITSTVPSISSSSFTSTSTSTSTSSSAIVPHSHVKPPSSNVQLLIEDTTSNVQYDQASQMSSNKAFAQLLPELMHIAYQRIQLSTSSGGSGSNNIGTCQIKAIALIEQLVRYEGHPLDMLVNHCDNAVTKLVSLARCNDMQGTNHQFLVSVLEIITHIFRGYHSSAIQQAVSDGILNLLCQFLSQHPSHDVRCEAAKALCEFVANPDELVAATLLHPQCNVIDVLCNKASPSGDMSQEVREQAALGILPLVRCTWANTNMIDQVLICCSSLLNEMTSLYLLSEVLETSSNILLDTSLHPKFEACGGMNALERLLYAGTMVPEIESKIVLLMNAMARPEEEHENDAMELEIIQPLSFVMNMLDGNGRLW